MCDRKRFLIGLDRLAVRLEESAVKNLLLYCRELQKWNRRINLIARDTPAADIVEKHFLPKVFSQDTRGFVVEKRLRKV